jgi:mono/diheme cytochrome c family protein/ABC-type amino acid transport substrate-binding protein
MRKMKKLIPVLAMGLAIFGSPALSDGKTAAEILAFGATTYKQFCSHCHGLNMVNPGTSSYDLRRWPRDNREGFESAVLNGKGDMPAWGDILLSEEVEALWHYVATRAGKEPQPEGSAALEGVKDAPLPQPELIQARTLLACLARNGGVMSAKRSRGGIGIDHDIAQALAARMGLDFVPVWFESEQEEETTPVKDTVALLSHDLCDIAPGFALYKPALSQTPGDRAPLPRWEDRPEHMDQRYQVDLRPIAVSDPYARMEIGLVYRDGVEIGPIETVADLEGLKLGLEQGTLPGVITIRQGTDRMVRDADTRNPGPQFLWEMEQGAFDAALVTVGAYDFHRRQNMVSMLKLHDYRHPLGFNLGVAMLEGKPGLLAHVDAGIAALAASNALAPMAVRAGAHYAAPRPPAVQPRLSLRDITALR